jgi:hypothetical protein
MVKIMPDAPCWAYLHLPRIGKKPEGAFDDLAAMELLCDPHEAHYGAYGVGSVLGGLIVQLLDGAHGGLDPLPISLECREAVGEDGLGGNILSDEGVPCHGKHAGGKRREV